MPMISTLFRVVPLVIIAAGAAGCRQQGIDMKAMITGPLPTAHSALQKESQRLGAAYDRKPGEKFVSLRYGQVLRQLGQTSQAIAVLQRAAVTNLNDTEISAAYGKVLAEGGRLKEAAEVLSLAHTPDRPNWQVLSAQGAIADRMGEHARAQELYVGALKIAPGEPSVLSNLGLSYALSRRLVEAERALSEAASHPRADDRVRANLAMVRDLQRKGGAGPAGAGSPVSGASGAPVNAWADIRRAEATRGKTSRTNSPRD